MRRIPQAGRRNRLHRHAGSDQRATDDKIQIITEHGPDEINVADGYLGDSYTQEINLIQITMKAGRTVEMGIQAHRGRSP